MNVKKLLTVGDSNSSSMYGNSWPDFLSEKLNSEFLRASSPGAGNSFYIEKLHEGLKIFKPDLVVVQLTEPSRIVTGLNDIARNVESTSFEDGTTFNDLKCFTWGIHNNDGKIKKITGKDVEIDQVWLPQISTSRWVDYKAMQDILTMNSLCSYFKTPVIFFSWFVDFEKLFLQNYSWIKSQMNWVPGHAWQILIDRKIPSHSPTDFHYGPSAHKILVDEWLYPELLSNFLDE